MNERIPLSIVIIAKNEENNIEDCLKSVWRWADEIVVIPNCFPIRMEAGGYRYKGV